MRRNWDKKRFMTKMGAMLLTAGIAAAPATGVLAAAGTGSDSNIALANDLENADIIDSAKTGSLTIYKYDITAAEAAGDYKEGTYEATGERDSRVEDTLSKYALEGVEFSYLRVGNVETHSQTDGAGTKIQLVYEIPADLAEILGLSAADAIDMSGEGEAEPCSNPGVYHFTGTQIQDAMAALLAADNVAAKNALEDYLYVNGDEEAGQKVGVHAMAKTDASGYTCADDLKLGLYLVVETEVPEQVTDTVNPWFLQLPFTNQENQLSIGGEQWIYDMTCYPKDQSGNPTLDKSVRNADDAAAGREAYGDTATMSEGDTLDYILVSKLPHITSQATYLSEYTFTDQLSVGLTYGRNAKIAFYHDAEDANTNNTANADTIWTADSGNFTQTYETGTASENEDVDGGSAMTITMTEKGLAAINGAAKSGESLSDYYMVVYYTAEVNSDAKVVLGDDGNQNNARLIWSRTSDGYYNMLEDRNYVYTYGLDLTKEFSDSSGKFENVQFKLYNGTDEYYVVAKEDAEKDGVYYVTGQTADENEATSFTPNAKDGSLIVRGIEADEYQLTEVKTDDGYSLLKDQIVIDITAADRDVIASVAGVTGMDMDEAEAIVRNFRGGLWNENGDLVTEETDELTGEEGNSPAIEAADGRTIGKTDMYVGTIQPASATVNGEKVEMEEDNGSADASVVLDVVNTKGFDLPKTGGSGLYAVTVLGVITVAGGCWLVTRKRKVQD